MTSQEILNGNELLDKYMGSKGQYVSHKDVWGGEYWGEYKPNTYYNDLNLLAGVIQKIEKENNITFELSKNGCEVDEDGLYLHSFDLPNWSNNVFKVIVEYLKTK
jgi:hypothetical protein